MEVKILIMSVGCVIALSVSIYVLIKALRKRRKLDNALGGSTCKISRFPMTRKEFYKKKADRISEKPKGVELLRFMRQHKASCDKSPIDRVETSDGKFYNSYFTVGTFGCKNVNGHNIKPSNLGTRFKHSCVIRKTKYGSFMVSYYDEFKRKQIELFPSGIKEVIYK